MSFLCFLKFQLRSVPLQTLFKKAKKPSYGSYLSLEFLPPVRYASKVAPSVSPSLREVRKLMDKYPDKVVLTELGKFYELYYENAEIYGPKLSLKVARRGYSGTKVSMAGFPVQYCYKYIDQLVNQCGVGVVLVKQYVKNPLSLSSARKFYRKVYRVITPGTIVEPDMLDRERNNFILLVVLPKDFLGARDSPVGLSWCDISTMELFTQSLSLLELQNDLYRISPSEVIIESCYKEKLAGFEFLKLFNVNWIENDRACIEKVYNRNNYLRVFSECATETINKAFDELSRPERNSMFALLDYVGDHFAEESNIILSLPIKNNLSLQMHIDSSAREALELTETIRTRSVKNTLFSAIKRTKTPSGTRLLRSWLVAPPFDIEELRKRLSLVSTFLAPSFDPHMLKLDRVLTDQAELDLLRLLFTIAFNSSLVSSTSHDHTNIKMGWHFLTLLRVLRNCSEIRSTLESYTHECQTEEQAALLRPIIENLNVPSKLVETIQGAINQDSLQTLQEQLAETEEASMDEPQFTLKKSSFPDMTWIINTEWVPQTEPLGKLRKELDQLLKLKVALESEISEHLKSLKPKFWELRIDNDLPNVYIQKSSQGSISVEKLTDVLGQIHVLKQSGSTKNFTLSRWSTLGVKILKLVRLIRLEETRYLDGLRKEVVSHFQTIKTLAHTVDYIDVLLSFAKLSREYGLVQPTLVKKPVLRIKDGRHLAVESSLQNRLAEFEPNSTNLGDSLMGYVILGPNMGGKSTYLRQNALIVILSHMGCFVPAERATVGLVDRIFTRIGAADDISNHSSTFMVEMAESANALNGATKNSLLIFDEIGRGTSNKEGIAIAYGILQHLVKKIKCRFLFATHYAPELNQLIGGSGTFDGKLLYYHTTLREDLLQKYLEQKNGPNRAFSGRFFDHKLIPGISKYSHATTIAKLADVPDAVIKSAEEVLNRE